MPRSREVRIPMGILVVLLSLGLAAGEAAAETAPGSAAPVSAPPKATKNLFAETPCAGDYEQQCSHTKGRRLGFECLRFRYKRGDLSQECADYTAEVRKAQYEQAEAFKRSWQQACADDIATHCSQYAKYTAITGCLNRIRDQLAAKCDATLPNRPGHAGPAYLGWKDGSEPENFDAERRNRLRPVETQRLESKKQAEKERQRVRDEVRARLDERQQGTDPASADESIDATNAP